MLWFHLDNAGITDNPPQQWGEEDLGVTYRFGRVVTY